MHVQMGVDVVVDAEHQLRGRVIAPGFLKLAPDDRLDQVDSIVRGARRRGSIEGIEGRRQASEELTNWLREASVGQPDRRHLAKRAPAPPEQEMASTAGSHDPSRTGVPR